MAKHVSIYTSNMTRVDVGNERRSGPVITSDTPTYNVTLSGFIFIAHYYN